MTRLARLFTSVALLGLAACGGGGSSTGPSPAVGSEQVTPAPAPFKMTGNYTLGLTLSPSCGELANHQLAWDVVATQGQLSGYEMSVLTLPGGDSTIEATVIIDGEVFEALLQFDRTGETWGFLMAGGHWRAGPGGRAEIVNALANGELDVDGQSCSAADHAWSVRAR